MSSALQRLKDLKDLEAKLAIAETQATVAKANVETSAALSETSAEVYKLHETLKLDRDWLNKSISSGLCKACCLLTAFVRPGLEDIAFAEVCHIAISLALSR